MVGQSRVALAFASSKDLLLGAGGLYQGVKAGKVSALSRAAQ